MPCQLQKVGDVADRLYWDNTKGKYVIEKNIGFISLTGEENWGRGTLNQGFFRATYVINNATGQWEIPSAISDKFLYDQFNVSAQAPN